ncbi:U32 family peptidase [bacterium]|nr:U32 family peptidase [bacterium]
MNIPELVAPAGNMEKLKIALHYGADAVFLGLSQFGLRARADNFTENELDKAIQFLHSNGKKAYVTLNIIPHNRDISAIREHLSFCNKARPDGIIISDIGVFEMAAELCPGIPLHVSTQANITNFRVAKSWERLGAKRLVLSRELTIDEIKDIRNSVSIELECFVHGAICISYSGRCYISSFLANRSANKGECTNSCRWNYTLMEETRKGKFFPVYENDRGTFILSSRDLSMIEYLDKLSEAGINSFKIEGRMKGINYVAGAVKVYREAIDSLGNGTYMVDKTWLKELSMISNRGYTTGMFLGHQPDNGYNHDEKVYRMSHELIGVIQSVRSGRGLIALRNTIELGYTIGFLSKGLEEKLFEVKEMYDEQGRRVVSGRNDEVVTIPLPLGVRESDLVRRPIKLSR